MESKPRITLVFLHDAGSSGPDINSFFSSIPLESFGNKTFYEVCQLLGVEVVTPTAQVRSTSDEEIGESLSYEWFAVSPDWRVLGVDNTQREDRVSMNSSKLQIHNLLIDIEKRSDYIILAGFSHGGNMCLELLNENFSGPFQSSFSESIPSIRKTHPKVIGVCTMASFLPNSSSILSHAYGKEVSNESKGNDVEKVTKSKHISILMMHGECVWQDTIIFCIVYIIVFNILVF